MKKELFIIISLLVLLGLYNTSMTHSMNSNITLDSNIATFAGGCFWCIEAALQELPGVSEAISGYTGGEEKNPSYELVLSGLTTHVEAVQVYYSDEISYEELVDEFLFSIDPTDDSGQFSDRGNNYKTAIFYHNEEQEKIIRNAIYELGISGFYDQPIKVSILPIKEFYEAEEYHQDYYLKEEANYKTYYKNSGREDFVNIIKETQEINEKHEVSLTPFQYYITQKEGTEKAFENEFWDNKEPGIYVDIVTGEALFSSVDKYDSGTGWPSFTQPLTDLEENVDNKLIVPRTELKSKEGTHLGHLFDDGPTESGDRYCINSASLKFIHKNDLILEGYEEYLVLFE